MIPAASFCTGPCACERTRHDPRLVVLTGGPGAGKTAVLELARRSLCRHVLILPEAAGVVFGGGFPRRSSVPARQTSQRAIFHVQRQMERLHVEEKQAAIVLCDRGTIDGLAHWPDGHPGLLAEIGTNSDKELSRYQAVIHLRPPAAGRGYNKSNPLRVKEAGEAAEIDYRIAQAWTAHPKQTIIDGAVDFPTKASRALAAIAVELPPCCDLCRHESDPL